jgi:hypothetical protein
VEAEIRSLAALLPLISLGLWAVAAAVGRHFGRRALAPLSLMAESARTMPQGDCRLPSPGTRDELEDFARSFNGLPDLERLDLAAWAADHLRAWSEHERAADLRFEGDDGEPLWARAHRPLLGQLLDNLFENGAGHGFHAWRHAPHGVSGLRSTPPGMVAGPRRQ